MKLLKLLSIAILFVQIQIYPQEKYLKLSPMSKWNEVKETLVLNEAMRWQDYRSVYTTIPTVPYELDAPPQITGSNCSIQFEEAAAKWCEGSGNLLKIWTNTADGVEMFFTTDER